MLKRFFVIISSAVSLHSASPQEVISKANKEAQEQPESSHFFNAGMMFDYEPNRLYQIYTKPERITDIALEVGENLISVAGGDSQRWSISESQSGKEPQLRRHILVKPHHLGISNNLVITTDRRTYHIEIHSLDSVPYQASISWKYPASSILIGGSLKGGDGQKLTPMSGVGKGQLNFNYHFVATERPSWMPRRIFDDGNKTYIEFPESMQNTEAPIIYGLTAAKEQEVLNYRRYRNFYIIDHLIERVEVMIDQKAKTRVGIEKENRT